MTTIAAASPRPIDTQRYRTHARRARVGRAVLLGLSSLLLLAYILAPMAWLVSSSFQSEREIVSKPPHWIPHEPTLENFRAIFQDKERAVTYETRRGTDPVSGGFIPSTASHLLPSLGNSLIVACAVVVLNLLVGVPAAYAMAKIRFRGRQASIYGILATRVPARLDVMGGIAVQGFPGQRRQYRWPYLPRPPKTPLRCRRREIRQSPAGER